MGGFIQGFQAGPFDRKGTLIEVLDEGNKGRSSHVLYHYFHSPRCINNNLFLKYLKPIFSVDNTVLTGRVSGDYPLRHKATTAVWYT